MTNDPYNLARFREAQEPVFDTVMAELEAGRKRTHWMWFIFPQLRDLGRSEIAQLYGIAALDEAQAYLADSVLGGRLERATQAALGVRGRSLHEVFGSPDDLKFRSSMTLFEAADGGPIFSSALDALCGGERDQLTLDIVGKA